MAEPDFAALYGEAAVEEAKPEVKLEPEVKPEPVAAAPLAAGDGDDLFAALYGETVPDDATGEAGRAGEQAGACSEG